VYDLCCDAYKSHGKTLSADFDRAVWAYCVEPFIMGEDDSQIHDQTMGGFLNLLLCAVGSPPEKRSSLKVGQKECCFDVRTKVYETWYGKLHPLPPRINEAVAALARFNAAERRAARIAAGVSPEPFPVVPSVRPPEDQVSQPPETKLLYPALPDSRIPSLGASEDVQNRVIPTGELPVKPSGADAPTTWDKIQIHFLSDERVEVRIGTKIETRNYAELGFEDRRNEKPNQAWETFRALAERRGVIKEPTKAHEAWPQTEKRIQEIRRTLRKHFGIPSDPIPFVEKVGYQARFKIGCRRSFNS
jgi:hypothetical protein